MRGILDRVSYHAVYDASILDALCFAHEHGFAGVQVAVEAPHLALETLEPAELGAIDAFRADHGLAIAVHGPDLAASLFGVSPRLLRGVFDYFAALFFAAERVGAKIVTLHLGQAPSFGTAPRPGRSIPAVDRTPLRRALRANLQRVLDLAAGRFVVCIENVGLNAMALDVLEPFLTAGSAFLCWDLAKARDDERVQRFYWRHVGCVRQVHLHDVAHGYSHQVVGAGEVDFMHYLPRLGAAHVLDWCIEVRPRERALESFANLRTLVTGQAR